MIGIFKYMGKEIRMTKCIDLVAGFFESGKTTFIKKLIEKEIIGYYQKILIINCEYGMESYRDMSLEGLDIEVVDIYKKEEFNEVRINSEIDRYKPDYVLIEYNGMWEMADVLSMKFRGFYIKNLISILDYNTFDSYLSNMESIIVDKIENSDVVVINKPIFEDDLDNKYKIIKSINRACDVFTDDELFLDDEEYIVNEKMTKSDIEIVKFAGLFFIFNAVIIGGKFLLPEFYSESFQRIMGVFISLLVQILPFLLLGALISSLIQVFVPARKFNSIFKNTNPKSMLVALFAGILFPVCDCAMVPIATSIVKKGYSAPVAITFLLASPAVNPIVILSTVYAFPNQPRVVIYRIVFGLVIALLAGLSMIVIDRKKGSSIIKDYINKYSISQSSPAKLNLNGRMKYIEAITIHTKNELFKMGFYLIIGAFISACLQVLVSKGIFLQMNRVNSIAVLVMILAAFFISICSTSNAFIARSFYNIMPMNSLLAFMVMGPMLDVTNLSVMLGTFKRGFVFKLILVLVYIAFVVFSVLGGGLRLV